MDSDSDSQEELFPIVYDEYDDLSLVTGVLRAVLEGDLESIKSLVNSGKSVNINDNNGNTPLHIATIKNYKEIVDYLLAQDDIVVNIRNFKGETPLFKAVEYSRFVLAKKLIQAGANVNLPNYKGVTPLHKSIDNRYKKCLVLETVCMLLYYNADVNALDRNEHTPFMKALILRDNEIQGVLLEYVDDFNRVACGGMTTLTMALNYESDYVDEIINRGADVNYSTDTDYMSEDTSTIFGICLHYPNYKHFKAAWEKFRYDDLTNPIDLCLLFEIQDREYFKIYLNIIIESDNGKLAVDSFIKHDNFRWFIKRYFEGDIRESMQLEQFTKLIYVLLMNGFRPTGSDICTIFFYYGYCELFKILLYMDYDDNNWDDNRITLNRIIFDLKLKMRNEV